MSKHTMIYNLRKFFWCATAVWFKDSKTKPELTELIYKLIGLIESCKGVDVQIDHYHLRIKTSSTDIELWNANKYYAWLCEGKINGRRFWGIQPSNAAMFDFKECLKKQGYNIYVPERQKTVDHSDVRC